MFLRDLSDPLAAFMEADSPEALWQAAVTMVETAGYAALNCAEVAPGKGPVWAKSSMAEAWLYAYATGGFHAIDPLMDGAMAGEREMRLQVGDLSLAGRTNEKAQAFDRKLAELGYGQFDAMTFDLKTGNRQLVVLISEAALHGPEAPLIRASRRLLIATLAFGLRRLNSSADDDFL
ncbi:MAG: hypothetical protein AAF390_10715 [Pseudomonadota bacterium]